VHNSIEPVNYENHPVFSKFHSPWQCSDQSIEDFSYRYKELRNGDKQAKEKLLKVLAQIEAELLSQCNSLIETNFVEELFSDVGVLILEQARFYEQRSLNSAKLQRVSNLGMALTSNGHFITEISLTALAKIEEIASSGLEKLYANAKSGKLRREDLSINSGRLVRKIIRVLNREFEESGVLKSLDSIAARRLKVVGLALELSVEGSSWWKSSWPSHEAPKTMYAHVDRSVEAPKAIVYLSDVNLNNGPTTCYPNVYESLEITGLQDFVGRALETIGRRSGSELERYYNFSGQIMNSEGFRNHFMKLPENIRFNSHFGWDVIPNSALEEYITQNEVCVIGSKGTTLVFDGGRLLHRGGLIENGSRVVLQVVFGRNTPKQKIQQITKAVINYVSKRI
jgi:hypothetical protein